MDHQHTNPEGYALKSVLLQCGLALLLSVFCVHLWCLHVCSSGIWVLLLMPCKLSQDGIQLFNAHIHACAKVL